MDSWDVDKFMQVCANNIDVGIQTLHMLEFEEYGNYYPAWRKF